MEWIELTIHTTTAGADLVSEALMQEGATGTMVEDRADIPDPTKPNGTPRKLLDVSKATALGWTYKTELIDGIRLAYEDFLHNPIRAER